MWLTEEEQRVWRAYLAMSSRLQHAMHRQLQRDNGLSLADYDVLVALSERGACRVNELCEHLAWEQSRLSHQLARMRQRGLVLRRGSETDRRGATVELTEAGMEAIRAAAPDHAELVRATLFEGMSADEQRVLAGLTERVLDRLATSPSR
jgi:DNA-binding MarR family transcriptional regulator